jgi:hypothetical protein
LLHCALPCIFRPNDFFFSELKIKHRNDRIFFHLKIFGLYPNLLLNGSISADRAFLGLPLNWDTVMSWLTSPIHFFKSFFPNPEPKKPNITVLPELKDYSSPAPESFWLSFPSFQIPPQPETSIDIKALASLVDNNSTLLLSSEIKRAKKCIEYLSNGAPAFQSETLGACFIKNSTNAITHGPSVTNTIASWVSKKFVAGPFSTPPSQTSEQIPSSQYLNPTRPGCASTCHFQPVKASTTT